MIVPKAAKNFLLALLLIICGTALMACTRQTSPEGAMTTAPVKVSDNPNQSSRKGGDYSLGVPACDDFFKKYEKCITENAPEANRQALRLVYEKTVEQVHLQYEKDKASVAVVCPQLRDGLKVVLNSYSCSW